MSDTPDQPDQPDDEIEQRLTAALEQRASTVQPSAGDLAAIEAGVAAERARNKRRTAWFAAAAAVVVVAAVAAFLSLNGDDGQDVVTDDPTTTTTEATTSTTTTTVPETTTTTTIPEDDDGVLGWPGAVARVFDNPESAALAFATDVLGFAEPTLAEGTTEGDEAEYVVHPRPTGSLSTRIHLHHTGAVRGWVVTGAASDQGTIDDIQVGPDGSFTITGSATAFEATLSVALIDLEGNYLEETTTMAGSNGEQGPYTATIGPARSGIAAFILIGEGDASGEGRLVWATIASVPEGDV